MLRAQVVWPWKMRPDGSYRLTDVRSDDGNLEQVPLRQWLKDLLVDCPRSSDGSPILRLLREQNEMALDGSKVLFVKAYLPRENAINCGM